ncbi:rCG53785 [Rattus norvegicus]|uniref:RCG53785 n=1 Tax=Rattus norvegicus TaxID=10116 RepID=A6J9N5_RAT|nr:rCG53785 [Rattus norvegicus]
MPTFIFLILIPSQFVTLSVAGQAEVEGGWGGQRSSLVIGGGGLEICSKKCL